MKKCLKCKKLKKDFIVKNSEVICLDCSRKTVGNVFLHLVSMIFDELRRNNRNENI